MDIFETLRPLLSGFFLNFLSYSINKTKNAFENSIRTFKEIGIKKLSKRKLVKNIKTAKLMKNYIRMLKRLEPASDKISFLFQLQNDTNNSRYCK